MSSDSHPILKSIRTLPTYNPHLAYPCLLAVFLSSNLKLPKDVIAYLARSKEVIRSAHQAGLSYYRTALQRQQDDCLVSDVLQANTASSAGKLEVHSNPTTPRTDSPTLQPRQNKSVSFSIKRSLLSLWSSGRSPAEASPPLSVTPDVSDPRGSDLSSCGFNEQVEYSLFNLSRIVSLLALQYYEVLKVDHQEVRLMHVDYNQILTCAIATIYEIPTIVSKGDFHIFMNTAFFGNSKYLLRYDASVKPTRVQSPFINHSYPNMLCRLFTHWSQDVREYLHRLLVFRIIIPYS